MMFTSIRQARVVRALFPRALPTAAAARCSFSSVISSLSTAADASAASGSSSRSSSSKSSSSSSGSSSTTKRIVFLGTPECAALSLRVLLEASKQHTGVAAATSTATASGEKEGGIGVTKKSPAATAASFAPFEIVAAVSQPPSRGKKNEEVSSSKS